MQTEVSFDKKYFPSLLKHLMNTQEQTIKKIVIQVYSVWDMPTRSTSHYLNNQVMSHDRYASESNSLLNETLINLLEKKSGCDGENQN